MSAPRTRRLVLLTVLALLVAAAAVLAPGSHDANDDAAEAEYALETDTLHARYEQWKAARASSGNDRRLVLGLGWSKALSVRHSPARGYATFDLADGTVDVRVSGLPARQAFDVWMVDNRPGPGQSVRPEPGDGSVRLGRLSRSGEGATLSARLDPATLTDFRLDLVVVTRAAEEPHTAGILFGSPTLFQRLYHSELRGELVAKAPGQGATTAAVAPFRFLVPSTAHADDAEDLFSHMGLLVVQGARLFFNETFDGNGRTCGTCHPAQNNFTIDPKFISTLPRNNPLFVAEFNPELAQLENPKLMREFGLILENVDGAEDPTNKFVMRGVPHTLALFTSLNRPTNLPDGPPAQMTGWSGDGAPDGGALRDFATGAVFQHFTKSLFRDVGKPFRLPTTAELNALEAFQLSLGRQADLDLATTVLKDPVAATGQQLFVNGTAHTDFQGRCNACHANAGANTGGGTNNNFNTGVEDAAHPGRATGNIPRDGGFGATPANPDGSFGDGRFNTPALVEAADTPPFFHNNLVKTIEEAVNFYNSPEFNNPRAATGTGIKLNNDETKLPCPVFDPNHQCNEVQTIAIFLRNLNALENIRSSIQYSRVAQRFLLLTRARRALTLAIAEVDDAIEVLTARNLHPLAVDDLKRGRAALQMARETSDSDRRDRLIRAAIEHETVARSRIVKL